MRIIAESRIPNPLQESTGFAYIEHVAQEAILKALGIALEDNIECFALYQDVPVEGLFIFKADVVLANTSLVDAIILHLAAGDVDTALGILKRISKAPNK